MLSSYRVLDLSDHRGMFCSYILAHLGAEVFVLEPPGGSSIRSHPPFANNDGLLWQAYSRGKQSVTIDIEIERQDFLELVAQADFVIESFGPKQASYLGVTYEVLSDINPALIVVSISAFGSTGPKSNWPATDLTVWASSGAQALAGDKDRAPVRTSVPQSFLHAGADAAGAALIALQERHRSGLGQQVDVSAQQSSAQAALGAILATPNNAGLIIQREAGGLAGVIPLKLTWPCKDGYVAITFLFGPAFTQPNRKLLSWIRDYGYCTDADVEEDWGARIGLMAIGEAEPEPYFELCRKIEAFTLERSQHELFEEGLSRGLYIAPTLDIAGLLQEKQFHAREFWQDLTVCDKSGVRVPGHFAKFSAGNTVRLEAAPSLSDSISAKSVPSRGQTNPPEKPTDNELPLSGLKVLDFMWVIAGPFFTRVLNDYGATVVRVESSSKLDPVRAAPPFKDGEQSVDHSVLFADFNAGKKGITIDPSNPVGREVILDLVRWADVVTESFSPKAMKGWGLDYETLKEINPDIIMMSSCLMGQTGPRAQVPGYGNMAAAISGFYELTGWPDRSPAGPYLAYTDGVAPRFMLASLLAALEHKKKTGEGQHIDISQAEAAIHFLAPAVLDYELNNTVWQRMGNSDLGMCPHGVFPATGEDRWVAISCQTEDDWRSLCQLADFSDELNDESLATFAGRLKAEVRLNQLVSDWSCQQDENKMVEDLIRVGIAAHAVQNSAECVADPQLQHRNHFVTVPHASAGDFVVEASRFQLARTPARIERAAPELGEHNFHVLMEVLGYDADKIADIYASLAME